MVSWSLVSTQVQVMALVQIYPCCWSVLRMYVECLEIKRCMVFGRPTAEKKKQGGLHYLISAMSPWHHCLYLKHGIHLAKLKWSIPVLLTALLSGGANYMFLKLIISYWEQRIATCSEKTKHTMPNDINRKLLVLTKSNEMQFRWQ